MEDAGGREGWKKLDGKGRKERGREGGSEKERERTFACERRRNP